MPRLALACPLAAALAVGAAVPSAAPTHRALSAARGRSPQLDRLLGGGPREMGARLAPGLAVTASGWPGAIHRVLITACEGCAVPSALLRDPAGGCPPAGADVWEVTGSPVGEVA